MKISQPTIFLREKIFVNCGDFNLENFVLHYNSIQYSVIHENFIHETAKFTITKILTLEILDYMLTC